MAGQISLVSLYPSHLTAKQPCSQVSRTKYTPPPPNKPRSKAKSQVILVTGGGSGIGLSLVKTLVTSGSQVFAVDISPAPSATELQVPNYKFLQCDLTKPGAPAAVVSACVEAYGEAIHGLCNVAGVMDDVSSVDTVSEAMWARNIGVNLTAPVFLMQAVIPHMLKAGGGSIANVASKAGTSGAIAGIAYTAAKHGLVCANLSTSDRSWLTCDRLGRRRMWRGGL